MCGINGFNFDDRSLVEKMNEATKHRGPDGVGVYSASGVSLGHNRLAIIDLSPRGAQPMKSQDGKIVITYNGELYNYKDLKKEIGNYDWQSDTDTEVILASYEKWGTGCVKKFNGMFAFAIWDTAKAELFLARDHQGIKPLYYYHEHEKFIFSSEIKGILAHPDVKRKLNQNSFNHYFRLLYPPSPATFFVGIKKLPLGSFATLKNGNLTIESYLTDEHAINQKRTAGETRADLKNVINGAVKRQLISDKPLGLYLSGGIDSSVILAAMKEEEANVDTFSIGFDLEDGEQQEKFNKDFFLARKTAKHFGARHHERTVTVGEAANALERVVEALDQPMSNATAIPMYLLAEFAKKSVDVVLTGDGGDELFGGYERYRLSLAATVLQKFPGSLIHFAKFFPRGEMLLVPPGVDRYGMFMFQKDKVLSRFISRDVYKRDITREYFSENFFTTAKPDFDSQFMKVDRETWLPDEALSRADTMSMSYGLEARVPFLDREVIRYADTIPQNQKVKLFQTKKILKDAYRDVLPQYLLNQPKRGWFSPGAKWLRRKEFQEIVRETLRPGYYEPTSELFNWDEVGKMVEEHQHKAMYHYNSLWSVMVFQIWARKFKVFT